MTNLNDEQALVGRTGMELVWGRVEEEEVSDFGE